MPTRYLRSLAALAAAVASTIAGAPAAAAAPSPPPPGATARLDGGFLLSGRVTAATRVRGEHVGETIKRTWTFTSTCATGQCAQVQLVRNRRRGSDRLVLQRQHAGYYTGSGSFYAPLKCGSHIWHRGEKVPFTVAVRITGTTLIGGVAYADRIRATYTNRRRVNLTPCVAFLGHDAASYHGYLSTPPPG